MVLVFLVHSFLYVAEVVRYTLVGKFSIGVPPGLSLVSLRHFDIAEGLGVLYPRLRQKVSQLVPVVSASEETLKLGEHRSWSEVIFEECFRLLVGGASVRNKARLLCLKNQNSGAWLAVCPSAALGLQLSNAEFNVLVRWRLGCEIGGGGACPLCGVASNSFGDHLVCCARNGVVRRHNAIAYYLSKLASASNLSHRVECGLGECENVLETFRCCSGGVAECIMSIFVFVTR